MGVDLEAWMNKRPQQSWMCKQLLFSITPGEAWVSLCCVVIKYSASSLKLLAGYLLVVGVQLLKLPRINSSRCSQLINYHSCQQELSRLCANHLDIVLLFPTEMHMGMHAYTNEISGCCDSSSYCHGGKVCITDLRCLISETHINCTTVAKR